MTREHYDTLLHQLDEDILRMGELVAGTIGQCIDTLEQRDVEMAQRLIAADNQIDEERYDVENRALLLIATQQPLASDLRIVTAILTIATELERIGDYCEGIAALTLRMAAEPFSGQLTDIRAMADITQQLLRQSLEAFKARDMDAAGAVWAQDDRVDELYEEVFRRLLSEMSTNKSSIRRGTYMLWVAHNIERMADRVTNIAERVAFVVTGDVAAFRDKLRSESPPS